MNLYTIILDFGGGTYINQRNAASPKEATIDWATWPDQEMVAGTKFKNPFWAREVLDDLNSDWDYLTPLTGQKNVWCISVIDGDNLGLINIVQTVAK